MNDERESTHTEVLYSEDWAIHVPVRRAIAALAAVPLFGRGTAPALRKAARRLREAAAAADDAAKRLGRGADK